MLRKHLFPLLANLHDDVEILVEIEGYDVELTGFAFNDDEGTVTLFPAEPDDNTDQDIPWDDDEEPTREGPSCDMKEVKDLPSEKIGIL